MLAFFESNPGLCDQRAAAHAAHESFASVAGLAVLHAIAAQGCIAASDHKIPALQNSTELSYFSYHSFIRCSSLQV